MPLTFRTSRRVEFRDTDAAGMVHFSVFFVYMEQAEHEMLRSLGLSVHSHDEQGTISFPRVSTTCDYQKAVHFEDVVEIEVSVARVGSKSITYAFRFTHDNQPIAKGQITTVCCRFDSDGRPRSIAIPAWFIEKLTKGADA